MNYEDMLNKAMEKVPAGSSDKGRFAIPVVITEPQGNATAVRNFLEIASALRREPQHLVKYLSNELATSAEMQGGRPTFLGRFRQDQIQMKVNAYAKEFVLCAQCGKPDTHFEKAGQLTELKCEACGARRVVRKIKGQ